MTEATSLERYLAVLEAAFTRLRGREHVLSARDFALVRTWHAAGWPVAWVLAEIERSASRSERPGSLEFLRRRVEARAARAAGVGGPPAGVEDAPHDAPSTAAPRTWSDALRAWLALRADHPACAPLPALLDALDAAETGDARQAALGALDRALDEIALVLCGPQAAATFRQEAARAAARQRGRLDDDALEAALRRYERRRARAALGVPERD